MCIRDRIKPLFSEIGKVPNELKKEYGQFVNEAKSLAESKYAAQIHLKEGKQNATDNQLDWSLPPVNIAGGTRHPISIVMDRICLLYTSPSPRDRTRYRMPSFA